MLVMGLTFFPLMTDRIAAFSEFSEKKGFLVFMGCSSQLINSTRDNDRRGSDTA